MRAVSDLSSPREMVSRFVAAASGVAAAAVPDWRTEAVQQEALELLKQLAPSVVAQHPNECLVLVHELEGLPLALQVAGRLLNTEANYGFGVVELIEDLREREMLELTGCVVPPVDATSNGGDPQPS